MASLRGIARSRTKMASACSHCPHPSRALARTFITSNVTQSQPSSPWPIFSRVAEYKSWRRQCRRAAILESHNSGNGDQDDATIGFVPTMGALHAGHLDLVRHSLAENKHTVVSIFVNPAQFSPTEDLSSYPRTLESDLSSLRQLEAETDSTGRIAAILCPDVRDMYPPLPGTDTPFTQDVSQQQGAFVEVKGLGDVLEGRSRPGFFRGVATVVTKLWHIVEPSRVYFGQKDIQQALILRALLVSLLFGQPSSEAPEQTFRLIPTRRDEHSGLALSSRNAYLSEEARTKWAPVLFAALSHAKSLFEAGTSSLEDVTSGAGKMVTDAAARANSDTSGRILVELDYISLNSDATLAPLTGKSPTGAILSGAMWITEGKQRTRLIDNLLLGTAEKLMIAGPL